MLRKGTKVIVPKNVQDESVINRSNIIPPTQRWYEINTEYFLTNKPDFNNVPFFTIYHFENDENRVGEINQFDRLLDINDALVKYLIPSGKLLRNIYGEKFTDVWIAEIIDTIKLYMRYFFIPKEVLEDGKG